MSEAKRVLLWRPAGVGDALWASAALPLLAADGWTVDVCVDRGPGAVFVNNPHVRRILAMEDQRTPAGRDLYAFPDDKRYLQPQAVFDWQGALAAEYERFIGLGGWLETNYIWRERDHPLEFQLPQEARRTDANFLDETVRYCGYVVRGLRPRLYPTGAEWADLRQSLPITKAHAYWVAWHLAGSAYHKFLPHAADYIAALLDAEPRARVVVLAGPGGGWSHWVRDRTPRRLHPRIKEVAETWGLRKQLLCTALVDLVVGPDSAITNAASAFDVNKAVVCSHIAAENLCKWWVNCEPIHTDASCYPCYRAWDAPEPSCYTVPGKPLSGARCCTLLPADFVDRLLAMLWDTDGRRCPLCGARRALNEPGGGFRCLGCGGLYAGHWPPPYSPRGRFAAQPEFTPVEIAAPAAVQAAAPVSAREAHVAVEQLAERECQTLGIVYARPELMMGEGMTCGLASPLARDTLIPVLRGVLSKLEGEPDAK